MDENVVGDVRQRTESAFEWKIPNWESEIIGSEVRSPPFKVLDTTWYIEITNRAHFRFSVTKYSLKEETVKLKLSLEKNDIKKYYVLDLENRFRKGYWDSDCSWFNRELLKDHTASCGSLIVSCEIFPSTSKSALYGIKYTGTCTVHTVGDISQRTQSSFVWTIPNWRSLIVGHVISPKFKVLGASWYIRIWKLMERFRFYIQRYSLEEETVEFRLCLQKNNKPVYNIFDEKHRFLRGYCSTIGLWYDKELLNNNTSSSDTLILSWEFFSSNAKVAQSIASKCTDVGKENAEKNEDNLKVDGKENVEDLKKLSDHFRDLFISGEDSDVTFYVQDREFKAHKVILRARLPFFDSMFTHDWKENKSGVVTISDCVPEVFEKLLMFLYSGKVKNISGNNVVGLYKAADKYGISEIKEKCVPFMMDNFSVGTFCDVIALALHYKEKALTERATDFYVSNAKDIISRVQWLSFMKEYPVEANELNIKALDKSFNSKPKSL